MRPPVGDQEGQKARAPTAASPWVTGRMMSSCRDRGVPTYHQTRVPDTRSNGVPHHRIEHAPGEQNDGEREHEPAGRRAEPLSRASAGPAQPAPAPAAGQPRTRPGTSAPNPPAHSDRSAPAARRPTAAAVRCGPGRAAGPAGHLPRPTPLRATSSPRPTRGRRARSRRARPPPPPRTQARPPGRGAPAQRGLACELPPVRSPASAAVLRRSRLGCSPRECVGSRSLRTEGKPFPPARDRPLVPPTGAASPSWPCPRRHHDADESADRHPVLTCGRHRAARCRGTPGGRAAVGRRPRPSSWPSSCCCWSSSSRERLEPPRHRHRPRSQRQSPHEHVRWPTWPSSAYSHLPIHRRRRPRPCPQRGSCSDAHVGRGLRRCRSAAPHPAVGKRQTKEQHAHEAAHLGAPRHGE
jgi:hypothetical protein